MIRHQLDPSILKAYDIRGEIGTNLNAEDAYAIGIGFANIVGNGNSIIIGRDGRHSSPMLAEALVRGLIDGGIAVIDIGIAPTPMLYFADQILNAAGAIQITGSHNPPQFNGFKFVHNHAPFFDADLKHLGEILAQGVKKTDGGNYQSHDISADYQNALLHYAGDLTPLKNKICVWDCGNGASGKIIESLTAALPGTHYILFAEIDGSFPNRPPDPSDPTTLDALRKKMAATNADLGFGFDGDGDRLGVIDRKGRHIGGDLLTAYLARGILRKTPNKKIMGAKIIFDIKSSHIALDQVRAAGGVPSLWKSGHSHIKARLKAENAALAGEVSGHIFVNQNWYGFDDALLGAIAVLAETAEHDLTAFMDSLPTSFATPEWRIACADDEKFRIIDSITDAIPDAPDTLDINTIDGVRVSNQDGWWLIRASNTGAELVARAEGFDEVKRARLCDTLYHWLTKHGKDATAIRGRAK